MTKLSRDQINALEEWIVALVMDSAPHADLYDAKARIDAREKFDSLFSAEDEA